jgi:protein-serine/threonine kinase
MTQLFASSPSGVTNEKRGNFPGLSLASKKHNESSHFPTRIKNFFRINSSSSNVTPHSSSERDRDASPSIGAKTEAKSTFRQSRFLPTIGRNRSTTVASEGNPLDEGVSPTATANPYFVHQGQPTLQHRNDGSVPSSPPDTPELQVDGVSAAEQATTANKEELARKLRRVASAPNAQGLFTQGQSDARPQTAEMGKEPLLEQSGPGATQSQVSLVEASGDSDISTLAVPKLGPDGKVPSPGQIRNAAAFRRTYSSNSIKVRNVEVGPSSFDKIKLIGKGDVGKVYLVREKKSSRLYAMKGNFRNAPFMQHCPIDCLNLLGRRKLMFSNSFE